MSYVVNDFKEYDHTFKTLHNALKFAYSELTAFMRKWTHQELETRVIWYGNGKNTETYVARIRYKGSLFTYYRAKNGDAYKVTPSGKLTDLTLTEKQIIFKVENNPKNW